MKGDIENLPIETINMFFEMFANEKKNKIQRYLEIPKLKEYHPTIKDIINNLKDIEKIEINPDADKKILMQLYKRLEDSTKGIKEENINQDIKFISEEINNIKIALINIK